MTEIKKDLVKSGLGYLITDDHSLCDVLRHLISETDSAEVWSALGSITDGNHVDIPTDETKNQRIARLVSILDNKVSESNAAYSMEYRRNSYDLSISEWCFLLGFEKSHYSEFLNGKRGLPVNAIRKAVLLGVPAECALNF